MKRVVHILLLSLLFFLTLQTHYEFTHPVLQGVPWDFGQMNLYGTDILLVVTLALMIASGQYRQVHTKYFIPLLFFGGILFLATMFQKEEPMSWYMLMRFLEGILLTWMIASSRLPIRSLLLVFVLGVTCNALFGAAQFLWQWVPANKWLGLASQQANVEGAAIVATNYSRYLRAYGFLPYPNILGLYLTTGFLGAVWLFIDASQQVRRLVMRDRIFSLSMLMCITLLTIGLLFSFSRSAWLGTGIGCALLLACSLSIKNLRTVFLFGLCMLVAAATAAAFYSSYAPLFSGRVEARGGHEQRSIADRANSFSDARTLFNHDWLSGIGLARSSYAIVQSIDQQRPAYQANPVQNLFVLLGVEAGIFSALAMVAVVWFLFWDSVRSWLASRMTGLLNPAAFGTVLLVVLIVMSFFGNYLPTLPSGIFLLFAVFGFTIKTAQKEQE